MVTEAPVTQSDGNTAFLRAARAGHLDKVLEHLKSDVDINTANANGLNALHLASKDGHIHVVTELLARGATVDASTKKGNTALHIASLAGQEEVVRLLVQHGAAVNVQSQNGFTPLYMAAQENHDNVVKFLLANGANQSLATEDGFTPLAVAMQQGHDKVVAVLLENDTRGKVRLPALHIAAKKDDCKAAALLLQKEHNPDVTSKSGFTPLHIAAHYGNEAIANLLLDKKADVNYSAKHNISPLHVAAKWGKTNLVALLLDRGAHIEAKTRDGLTPLHCAARSGHEQVVDMMLERGAPISCKTKNGLAPLHMAAQGDHVDAARILLYHRAPVDEVTVDYLTALHVAAHCGHVRVAKLLLERKADPNARALNGFTPLHIACKKNRIKVVELLLKYGASIEATTESGLTPLHVASFMGCMNIVIYLLQNEANPDVPTVRGETPLHLAARANQTDIIRILLRNGAQVDARAREQQTPLHIASRLGNFNIVMLLLQHGAAVDSTTKDLYTALHIAAKEGQEEVAAVLLDNGANPTATTNKGCTPLHLAAKYGNIKVAKLLLQKDAPVDSQGKNGVTPLHVASHYDHQNVALLLLDKGASPHATAKNGHTPLHIAARKNQMDIATTLLEYGAKANAESRAGFTPLHLSAQEGHTDMSTLLIEHEADVNHHAKNGLTPLHLCAQEDRVNVAQILVKAHANVDATTKAGYTPLHVASHFGQVNMVRFLLQNKADSGAVTSVGYTPLHQAAQQGHSGVVSILLSSGAQPNVTTKQGQTALSIAQKLGYISVVETLKVVTEVTTITTTTTTTIEEKYRVVAPETMQETFMSDSEEEGGEDTLLNEQPYHYLTVDEMKSLGDDSLPIDVTQDDRHDSNRDLGSWNIIDGIVSPQHAKETYASQLNYSSDNVDISRHPVNVGFLVSFLVDARGGAMRGCRHSGVRVIVPPRKAPQPLRVTCRYLKRDKLSHPPPLMEGEALASRILELGPVGAKFLGPVIIEVPHFGSLRGREREIVILRSDNGETWREHTVEASEETIHDVLNESFEKDGERNDLNQLEVCDSGRLTRILTTDFPQYFAVVSRVRQEVHAIGPEGGMVSSSVVPQVQAVFPQGALTKKIKVGLQAQPIPADLVAKLLGNRVAVSPIVTVEPRRRKFHKPITLTIPVPQAANKGMINQYSGDAPTLRLLCSITGGTTRAQWEDVTGSTPLTFVNDCVSFTTTVSARFWLMDCRNISEATKMATELYKEAIHVPFLAKFVVFAKRVDYLEARLRVFCMTDDKEDKTLEHQEHFTEVAKSRDVEVLEGKAQFVEFAGNLVPVTKSGDQLQLGFRGFRENRLAFTTRVKDLHADPVGRILFMKEAKVQKGDPPQQPVCVLNIVLPEDIIPESSTAESTPQKFSHVNGSAVPARPELRLSDISNTLGSDWESLAVELGLSRSDVERIKCDHPASAAPQLAMAMLRLWLQRAGNRASGSELQQALQRLGRDDIVHRCMMSCDDQDVSLTMSHTGLDELGMSRDASRDGSLLRNLSLEAGGPFDEQDIMKDSESVEELVHKQHIPMGRIEESKRSELQRRERDDREERKYIAEEKEVEERRKSVRERTQDIEKRLSQTSIEEQQQRRDSQLFQGVSEGLERLNIGQATEAEDLLSPGIVRTPPPSPAELPNDAGEQIWQESKISTAATTISTEQHSGFQGAGDIRSEVQPPTIEGRLDSSEALPPLSAASESKEVSSVEGTQTGSGDISSIGQPTQLSAVEETFTKSFITPAQPKEVAKSKEEKKKEKKEREKEEKEKKKKEKREKEQKEREEKERKDREKKEKKEREKKEKEEREKKDKEGKKTKYEKEKADKEKMEKESKDLQSGKDEHFQKTMSQRERFEDSSRMENATSSPEVVDEVCTKEVKLKPTIPTTITTVTLPKSKSVAESHKSTTEEGDASGNGEIDVTVSATVIDATTQNDDNSYNSRPLLNSQSLGTNSLIQCNEENTTESISQGTETFFKSEQPRPFEKATPDTTGVNQTEQAHSLVIACLEMCDQTDIALPTNVAIYSDKSGSVKEISDSRKKQEPDIKEKSFFVKSCLSEYVDEPISKSVDIECSVKSTDKRLECSAPHLYSASPDPKMQPVMTDKETVVIGVTESIKNDKPETALQSIVSETSFTNHKIIKDLHEPKELKVKTRTLTENSLIQEDYLDDNMGRERSVISSVGEEQSTLESANTPKKVVEKMKKSLNLSELQSIQPFLDGDLLNKTKKELPLGTIQSDASTPLKVEKNHSFDLQPSVAPPVSSDGLVEKTPDQTSVANISKTPNLQNDTKEKEQPLYDEDNIQKNTQTQQVTVVDPSVQLTLIDSSTQFADRDEKGNYLMSNIEQPTVSKKEDSRLSSAIPQVFNDVTTTCRETLRTSSESSGINSAIHSVDELNIQSAEGNINKGDSETRILSTASGSMKKEEDSDIESARLCKSKQELSKILKDVSLGKPDTIEELKEPILSIDGGNIPRFKCREQTSNLESITFTSPTIHEGLCTSDRDMKESSRKPEEFSKSGSSVDQILAPTPSLSEAQLSSELGKEMGSPKNVVTETVVMREYTFDGTPPDVRTLTTLSGHGMDLKSDNVPDQLRSTSDLPITSSRADDFKATVEKVSPVVKTVPTVTNPIICKGDDIPAHLVLENVDVPLQLNLTHRGVEESSPISVTSVVSHKTSFISEKPEDEAKTMVTHIKTKSDRESGKNELKLGLLDESSEDFSSSFLDDDFLQNAPKVSIVKTETKRVFTTAAGGTSMPLGDPEVLSSTVSYVTTPTMQRRAHSQRRSREERPAPVDVTYTQDDLSDSEDENYIVTEPLDETEKVEDRFRINSSPEILNVNPTRHESVRRSPDQNRVKFQLGSLDSQDSLSSDGVTPQTPGAKTHKFTVEKVNEEDGIPKSIARSGATNTDKNDRAESEERMEKKLRRVERHFERMASQSFAGESAPDERDTDFQRVVSQLSREEMAGSEDEYENLLIEATTPSDEWDSRADTDDTPEAVEATMLRTTEIPPAEARATPTFVFTCETSEEGEAVDIDSDEEPTPPPVPSSMFWSFDDRPLRGSSVSLDEMGLPLGESSSTGEVLSHWDNTDRLDLSVSVEEPELSSLALPVPRPPTRSTSVVESLLLGNDTIPAPLARSVLRSTVPSFPDIPEVPSDDPILKASTASCQLGARIPPQSIQATCASEASPEDQHQTRPCSPFYIVRSSVQLEDTPLGLQDLPDSRGGS